MVLTGKGRINKACSLIEIQEQVENTLPTRGGFQKKGCPCSVRFRNDKKRDRGGS